jgi:hypothetical protein
MKKQILFIMITLLSAYGFSQANYAEEIKHSVNNQDKIQVDSIARTLGYEGGDNIKVFVIFEVNREGNIHNVRARGPHKVFEDEAIRVVSEIPQLDPLNTLEADETMKFTLPLTLVLETESEKRRRIKKEEKRKRKAESESAEAN